MRRRKERTNYQKEVESMAFPLGSTFADFFMSHTESYLLNQDRFSNTVFY